MADRGQREVDEKSLGTAFLQECAENHEQDDIGCEHVGHDAEHAVAFIEDAGAQVRKSVAGMRDQLRSVLTEHAVSDHDAPHDNEHHPDHAARDLDTHQHARNRDPLVDFGLGAGAIIDCLEIENPVAERGDGKRDQQKVADTGNRMLRAVNEKNQDVGNDDVNAAVVLGCGRRDDCRVGIKQYQPEGHDIEQYLFDLVHFFNTHGCPSALFLMGIRSRFRIVPG